jgi:16S rRNA (cytosine967-C5)-methyltransferase
MQSARETTMRLGGRLAAAIEILQDIEHRHRPAADALKDWGLSHRFAGAGDRAAIGNIVYDSLRRKRSAGWLLDANTPRASAFGALLIEGGHSPQTLDAALAGDRFAPEPLNAGEHASLAGRTLEDAPEEIRADIPEWCVPHLKEAFGDDWVEEGRALASRPPLDLRVNTLKAERARVIAELKGTGAAETVLAPHGLRIPPIVGDGRHPNVQVEPSFQKGWFEVQDEGSQVVSELSGAKPGVKALDYCAGAGGKTLALSAATDNRGQIFAYDADKARLAPIFARLKRAGSRNVQVVSSLEALHNLSGQMDIVLVDAPCTGSGTWRRRPDAKWRLTLRQLDARIGEQEKVLDEAARFVKPGGILCYVTCSILRDENQSQVAAFMARNAGFSWLDHTALWGDRFPGSAGAAHVRASGIALTPARTGTDGFFFAALQHLA